MGARQTIGVLLLASVTALGQPTSIGQVTFLPVNEEGKPKETLGGQVRVFEDNQKNRGRQISIHIEVVPARQSTNKAEPMFIIMGGPGQAATDLVGFFADILQPINQRSDLVFIDQRGTGKSNALRLAGTYNRLQDYFEDDFTNPVTLQQSRSSLAQENNLSCYGTRNAVADLEYIRKAMGYPQINLYGTSYGTRVALAYINAYPKQVRTATLKGLVPPGLVIPHDFAADAQRSLDLLLADCQQNEICNTTYPNLAGELQTFFARFPMKVSHLNPETNKRDTITLTKDIVALNLRVLLMSPSTTRNVPFWITQFNQGHHEPLTSALLAIKKSYRKGVYDGMTLCVLCFEDYPALVQLPAAGQANTFLGDYWINRIKTSCAIWNPERRQTKPMKVSRQNTPVLLISGNRDAATPPAYGEEVLKYFPNGRHVVVDAGSHSFDGMRNCVENIICDFVLSGQIPNLKTDCVGAIGLGEYRVK